MVSQPTRIPAATPALARFLPAAITVGVSKSSPDLAALPPPCCPAHPSRLTRASLAVSAVALSVRSQLMTESQAMDRFFSKYNNPQSEAMRQKVFDGAPGTRQDPRKSLFNVLGW